MTIIHISTDYPDKYQPAKTSAISNLVDVTKDDFNHQVYSLNRKPISPLTGSKRWVVRDWNRGIESFAREASISSWTYEAPSNGLFLNASLDAVADILAEDIIKQGHQPTLIHGHKLSMEGFIAQRIAQRFGIPFALSIQGNTDRNILNIRRDLWPKYRKIFHKASVVFPFTPWAFDYCENILGKRSGKTIMLPCITQHDEIIPPKMCEDRIMSAFHLRHWKIKGLDRLSKASGKVEEQNDNFALDIYGGGSDELMNALNDRCLLYTSPSPRDRG